MLPDPLVMVSDLDNRSRLDIAVKGESEEFADKSDRLHGVITVLAIRSPKILFTQQFSADNISTGAQGGHFALGDAAG